MRTLIVFTLMSLATVPAWAQSAPSDKAAGSCEQRAKTKDGKPLAGAAKTAFIKKCEAEGGTAAAGNDCEAKALDKNGKPLAGAAKVAFMKKCEAGTDGKSGCESKAVTKDGKPLAGAAKTAFMKKCEAEGQAK